MKYLSTLDIDTNDKEKIRNILRKIRHCQFLIKAKPKHSSSKGVHVILWCSVECDICRFVYDDFRRFAFDQYRNPEHRNILFDVKIPLKSLKVVIK